MNKQPKIRFEGFSADWEEFKLEEIVDIRSGCDYKHLSSGIIPVYGTGGYMLSVNRALSYEEDGIGIGRKGTIDKPYILKAPFWTVDTLFYAVPQNDFDLEFDFCVFQKIRWREKDESTGVPSLSKQTINSVKIYTPRTTEQIIIGRFFKNLDNLINLKQCKYDKLVNVKKAMLEKMFSKDDEKIPKIRFEGFCEDWEERKLKEESLDIVAGGDIDKNRILESGQFPVFANALTNSGIVGYYSDEFRIVAPAITVTGRGDVGHAKARRENFTPVVRLLSVKTNHDIDFLEQAINNHRVMVESTGVPQLTVPQLSKYKIFFPDNLQEERKIGELFLKLDDLITLHQQELDKLKNIKKSLLEKMFVS